MSNTRSTGRDATSLSMDDLLRVLSSGVRRRILRVLIESETDSASVGEVTKQLMATEFGQTGELPDYETLLTTIYYTHLPQLEFAGVIDYQPEGERDTTIVRYHENTRLEAVLKCVEYIQKGPPLSGSNRQDSLLNE